MNSDPSSAASTGTGARGGVFLRGPGPLLFAAVAVYMRLLWPFCGSRSGSSRSRRSRGGPGGGEAGRVLPFRIEREDLSAMARLSRTALLVLLGTLLVAALASSARASVAGEGNGVADSSHEAALEADHEELEGSGDPADEKDVAVLGAQDFAEFVMSNQFVLVEFYAPWCGHCQSLTPEYARAATALKDSGVVLAKVDAVANGDLAQEYGVDGYPTLFFFVDGEKKPYTGGRTSDEIVTWVTKRTGPTVTVIKTAADADALLESDDPVAIAYLQSVEGADADEFTAAARLEDGVDFQITADEEIAKKFGLKNIPALVLLKKENEKVIHYDGAFEKRAISDFISENKLPLVIPFNRDTASIIFEGDVTKQLLLFANPDEFEKIRPNYEEAAKSFKKKIVFVLIDLEDEEVATPVLEFFALDNEKTRLVGFVSEQTSGKYLYDGDFTVDSLKEFSEKFLVGDLAPFRKSQSPPEANDEPVKIVVASTFEEIVLDESKDVIFEVYAPWCGHCQSLEPEYNLLAESLKNISSIVIAKMDGTKNEHERLNIEGYPTLLFYPAGDKSKAPTPLDTERTAYGFIKFLKAHATIPFEAPNVPEPVAEPEPETDLGDEGLAEEEVGESADQEYEAPQVQFTEAEVEAEVEAETEVKDEL